MSNYDNPDADDDHPMCFDGTEGDEDDFWDYEE